MSRHGERGRKQTTSNAGHRMQKKTCCPTGTEPDASPMNTPGRKPWSTRALEHWGMPCEIRPKPDRESNEMKYLREATELIEKWQLQLQDGQPVSRRPSEHSEVILVERQRESTVRLLSDLVCCCVVFVEV